VVLILAILYPNLGLAQVFHTESYSSENGLPGDRISAILHTKDEFMWFGVDGEGLVRFDGLTSEVFSQAHGLRDKKIITLFEDSEATLWIATDQGGVAKMERDSIKYLFTDKLIHQIRVNCIIEPEPFSDEIWFGTGKKGVYLYDKKTKKLKELGTVFNEDTIYDFYRDTNGDIWISSNNGLFVVNPKTKNIKTIPKFKKKTVFDVERSKNGEMWVATAEGLFLHEPENNLNKQTGRYVKHYSGKVTQLSINPNEEIWFTNADGGVFIYEETGITRIGIQNGISDDKINILYRDHHNRLWIGTKSNGVDLITTEAFVKYNKVLGISIKEVFDIHQKEKGIIWFGTDKGLFKVTTENAGIEYIRETKGRKVWELETLDNGVFVLLLEDNVLYLFDGSNLYPYNENLSSKYEEIFDLYVDSNNRIWIGTSDGLIRIDKDQNIRKFTEKDGLSNNFIWHLSEDSKNRIWIGTNRGVTKFENERFEKIYKLSDAGFETQFRYITEAKNGDFWMGTNEGIIVYREAEKPRNRIIDSFNNDDGLLTLDTQFLIFDAHQQLWHGTSAGLQLLDVTKYLNTGNLDVTHYELSNKGFGISFSHNAVLESEKGDLWFGTKDGAMFYETSYPLEKSTGPTVIFKDISVISNNDNESDLQTVIPIEQNPNNNTTRYVSAHQNTIQFSFHALDYKGPEKIEYSYYLKGYDENWTKPSGITQSRYTDLESGSYTFYVKARGTDGVWSHPPASFIFTIKKPFWKTYWFFGLIGIFVVAALILLERYRLQILEKNKLKELVDEQTKELKMALREKEVLIQEVHHRIKNNLAVISGLLELQKNQISEPNGERILMESQMRVRSIALIHEKLYQNETLANINFKKYIEELVEIIASSYNIEKKDIDIKIKVDDIVLNLDQSIPCGLILNELVSNSFEHAFKDKKNGSIYIGLKEEKNFVYFEVEDDGTGIPEEYLEGSTNSLGLTLVDTLTKQLGGKLSVKNHKGTRFSIIFEKESPSKRSSFLH